MVPEMSLYYYTTLEEIFIHWNHYKNYLHLAK